MGDDSELSLGKGRRVGSSGREHSPCRGTEVGRAP